jgi:hypothetical protein
MTDEVKNGIMAIIALFFAFAFFLYGMDKAVERGAGYKFTDAKGCEHYYEGYIEVIDCTKAGAKK